MAVGGGISSGPTPWWQLPGQQDRQTNLINSAPAGYTYDSAQMKYVPTVESAPNRLANQTRGHSREDALFGLLSGGAGSFGSGGGTMGTSGMMGASGMNGGAPGSGSPYGAPNTGSRDVNPGAPVLYAGPSGQQEEASRAAIFARNKDNAANTGRAALTGLSGELSARGMGGAGYEAGQIGRTVANAADTLGESDRMQAQSELAHAQHVGDLSYQGDIAQRAQNLGAASGNADRSLSADNSAANRGLSAQLSANGLAVQERISANSLAQQKQLALASLLRNALGGAQVY